MTRRREPLLEPRQYVTGDWPDGILRPGAPLPVHYIREMVVKARDDMEKKGIGTSELSKMMNFDLSTIRKVLNGYHWPDTVTVIKMEQALGISLWPAWGDTTVRDQANRIAALEQEIKDIRSRARKRAAAARAEATAKPSARKAAARKR